MNEDAVSRGEMNKHRGFTLIEMALVVAIIGLMVGGGAFAITPLLRQARINTTDTALDQLEAALALFATRNSRLPCPADGSLTSTSANYGLESGQTGNTGVASDVTTNSCSVTDGHAVIPWKTLGIDETYSLDGWGNRISYMPAVAEINGTSTGWNSLVDNAFNTSNNPVNCLSRDASTTAPPTGFRYSAACDATNTITTGGLYGTADYNVPTYPFGNYIAVYSISGSACSTELTVPNTNQASGSFNGANDTCTSVTVAAAITSSNVSYDGQRAAYVLISHGQSGWYAWSKGGTQLQPYTGTTYPLKQYNSMAIAHVAGTTGNGGFVQGNFQSINNLTNANFFDDIVRWRSPGFVIENCGSSACGNP
jgi:prepilin-type N-terminal cleavage/methylation domain-containing protein